MFFWDRLLLAQFSIEAHNAATSAGCMVAVLQFAFICTTCIAEVFVGQYNGAGEKNKIGKPVWQMIWLSVFSLIFFVPMGMYSADILFMGSRYQELEVGYFKYLMFFGPIFCVNGALSAFYIGRGCVTFVTCSVILANILNTIFAYVLIFGMEPFISPLGIEGAALATGIAQTLQAAVLFIGFVLSDNRKTYGTGDYAFNWVEFKRCLQIGLPSSVAHTIEIFAWALFFRMLTNVSDEHITVVSIAQSIFYLFTFITEGISKGATAIAANMIGARQYDYVWKLLRSGVKFYFVMFILLGGILALNPSPLIQLFIANDMANGNVHGLVASACFWVWIFFLLDGIHWLVVGLLTAAGDTKFVLKTGGSVVWLFALLPTYVLIVVFEQRADVAWAITALYGLATCAIYLWRFHSEKWKRSVNCLT